MNKVDGLFVLVSPDWCTQRFADTKANAHGNADDEEYQEDLDDDAVSRTEAGHAVTGSASLGCLGLLLPLILSRPYLAVTFSSERAAVRLVHARVGGVGGDHGFDIRIKRVGTLVGARC